MKISTVSQLGLRLNGLETQIVLLELLKEDNGWMLNYLEGIMEKQKNGVQLGDNKVQIEVDSEEEGNMIKRSLNAKPIIAAVKQAIGEQNCIDGSNSSYYFICDTVYRAAELIRVNTNFTGRTLKDIKDGKYTYLMGKNRCIRFVCSRGGIMGFYFDDQKRVGFEFGIELASGAYYFTPRFQKEFTEIMQVLTFIELGDIEIKTIEAGRNNGLSKKSGKLVNESRNTVYVVDSSWNQIVIRTEGFAVRGHFRLQPSGPGLIDRKLIWIAAFEKHGYTRRPRAEIID